MKHARPDTDEQKIIQIYEDIAHWFDQNRRKSLEERDYLNLLLGHLGSNSTVLDVGCGSGEPIAQYLIEQGCQLTGIDSAAQMIALCRARFPAMTWIQADMRKLKLARKFDAVIAWDSFFHLGYQAQQAMFPLFRAHLADEGLLLFTSGSEHGEAYGTMQGHRIYHASLDADEYRFCLKAAGFKVLLHRINDPVCNRTVWLAKC